MQKVTPFLWFDSSAGEAADFYVETFGDAEILDRRLYGEGMPSPAGSVMSVTVRIHDQELTLFNGGPHMAMGPAISLFVSCETQQEIDHLWENLADGGQEMQCGWVTDRYGVTWQIVPSILGDLLGSADGVKGGRAAQAMMGMVKFDIAGLQAAHDGLS